MDHDARRAALRREFIKQVTSPHSANSGHVFDPAFQRFQAVKVSKIEHFRETPKSVLRGFFLLLLPVLGTYYVLKTERERKEAEYRSGKVAYKDRLFKFI